MLLTRSSPNAHKLYVLYKKRNRSFCSCNKHLSSKERIQTKVKEIRHTNYMILYSISVLTKTVNKRFTFKKKTTQNPGIRPMFCIWNKKLNLTLKKVNNCKILLTMYTSCSQINAISLYYLEKGKNAVSFLSTHLAVFVILFFAIACNTIRKRCKVTIKML